MATPTLHLHPPTHKRLSQSPIQQNNTPIAHTLQFNKHTRCYTLVNVGNQHNWSQGIIILELLKQFTCLPNTCTCMTWLRPDILCILRTPIDSHTTTPPPKPITIQFILFTYCHDRFPVIAIGEKTNRHDPLIQTLKTMGWNVSPLTTVTSRIQGVVHK